MVDVHPGRTPVRQLERFTTRSALGLLAIVAAGVGFGMLLLLVRIGWAPLRDLDRGVAGDLNGVVAPHQPLVTVLTVITSLGGRPIMVWLVSVVAVGLFIRRQPRLAAYLLVTGAGALILDPSLKLLVGRLRPVVDIPVASASGNSFPSGHALGSTVTYGALLLIFLPALRPRWRRLAIAATGLVVVLIGFTRIALGVHFVSDVLAGWLLGIAWLGVTAYAFRLWRAERGQPVPALSEGLAPEAGRQIAPAPEEYRPLAHPGTGTAEILSGWVIVFGVLCGAGVLASRYAGGTIVARWDTGVPRWFAEHRTATFTGLSWYASKAGDTHAVLLVCLVVCPLLVAALRRWRPVLFLALAMFGELSLFLATAAVVQRPRPDVSHLDGHLPTSSFPSGHVAATICLYGGLAVLAMRGTQAWWRWLTVVAAVLMPVLVATSRMYRGMHHPSDVFGSALLAALWLGVLYHAIRPGARAPEGYDVAGALGRAHGG